jgi:uncharacterized membrane protein YfcA
MLAIGMSPADAAGTSLGAVAASTLYGCLRNWRVKQMLWLPGLILAASGAIFAPLGKWIGLQLPASWLLSGFSMLAMVIAWRMWVTSDPDDARILRASDFHTEPRPGLLCNLGHQGQFELKPRCVSGLLIGGSLVGVLSGLFGVGGGFLIVPLLLALSPISMRQAVGTSLLIIAIISSSGFASHIFLGEHSIATQGPVLLTVAGGGVLGMFAGQLLSQKLAGPLLQRSFALSLAVVTLFTLLNKLL